MLYFLTRRLVGFAEGRFEIETVFVYVYLLADFVYRSKPDRNIKLV